jgi:hypothetical protein
VARQSPEVDYADDEVQGADDGSSVCPAPLAWRRRRRGDDDEEPVRQAMELIALPARFH